MAQSCCRTNKSVSNKTLQNKNKIRNSNYKNASSRKDELVNNNITTSLINDNETSSNDGDEGITKGGPDKKNVIHDKETILRVYEGWKEAIETGNDSLIIYLYEEHSD